MHSDKCVGGRTRASRGSRKHDPPLCWGRGSARPPRTGPTGTGLKDPWALLRREGGERVREEGPAHPQAWGPKGISPCSTPRRAASSTGRKTFILEKTGVLSGVSQRQRKWPCLERHLVGGPGLRAPRLPPPSGARAPGPGAGLPPLCRWQGGPASFQQQSQHTKGLSVPLLTHPSLGAQSSWMGSPPPPPCAACGWGQPRELISLRTKQKGRPKEWPHGRGPGGEDIVTSDISQAASRTFHEPAPFLTRGLRGWVGARGTLS